MADAMIYNYAILLESAVGSDAVGGISFVFTSVGVNGMQARSQSLGQELC